MRLDARRDANQDEIVKALRKVGASVAVTHQLGGGFPDLVVGYRGVNYLIEIKDGSKPPSQRRLTKDERKFFDSWRGDAYIAKSADRALKIIGAI